MINTSALILMVTTQVVVASITIWFFYKVLTIPPRPEPDSYEDNDEENLQ